MSHAIYAIFNSDGNLVVDVVFMYVFGVFQYSLIGYFIGYLFDRSLQDSNDQR